MRLGVLPLALALAALGCGSSERFDPNGDSRPLTLIRGGQVAEVDLLLVVDNSPSMADKQALLADVVPALARELTEPRVNDYGMSVAPGLEDIHIGVITSSLGGHGAETCRPGGAGFHASQDDHGRLLPSVRAGLGSQHDLGFLWWDPRGKLGGEQNETTLAKNFADHVRAAGETGCGYEAPLEAWYRFLVDPAPPAEIVVENGNAVPVGVDEVVLRQRADFLRPGSLVAIIMLSDENDCSIVDGGSSWVALQISDADGKPTHLPRGTSACQSDPHSECCRPCSPPESAPPPGCEPLASDPACKLGDWDDPDDDANLRCWRQKQRFGTEFLYPTWRYVEAVTQPRICPHWDAKGPVGCSADPDDPARVESPLFGSEAGGTGRSPGLVTLGGIVGVPWQDIATDDTLTQPELLRYRYPGNVDFDLLTPKCRTHVDEGSPWSPCREWDLSDEPDDPLMIESTDAREGKNPITGDALVGPTGTELANPINGHEWAPHGSDLQYACIFPLDEPRDCGSSANPACDCSGVGLGYSENSPLCQQATSYAKTQRYAKAFPGTRQLEVLRDVGGEAILASVCPKITHGDTGAQGYGYNPAVRQIVDKLSFAGRPPFDHWCLPHSVGIDSTGHASCWLFDVRPSASSCDCSGPGLAPVSAKLRSAAVKTVLRHSWCGKPGHPACPSLCLCELAQLSGAAGEACQRDKIVDPALVGFCAIDRTQGVGSPELDICGSDSGLLRFVGVSPKAGLLAHCER